MKLALASTTVWLSLACGSSEPDEPRGLSSGGADELGGTGGTGGSGQPIAPVGGQPGTGGAAAAPGAAGGATAGAGSNGTSAGSGGSDPGTGGSQIGTGGLGGGADGSTTATGGSTSGGTGVAAGGAALTGGSSGGTGGSGTAGSGGVGSSAATGGSGTNTGGADTGTGGSGENLGGSAGADPGSSGGTAGGEGDLCDVGVWDGSVPRPLDITGNTFAHDPTMVEAGGTFYRFWTGDRIPSATSTDLVDWQDAPAVFSGGYSSWVDEWLAGIAGETFNFPWAPDASYFNGRFHLYSSFSAKFGDNISCITHLTSDGPTPESWTDHGPVICTRGDEPYNAIDADLGLDQEGNPYLAFGSFWDGIMAIPLNADGSRRGSEISRLAWASEIEAPVLFRRCGYHYLFVTWGLCCPGEGRSISDLSYRVAVGRSENILGPYVDRNGRAMLEGGGTLLVQGDRVEWAAAGHSDVIVAGSRIYHFYHAYRQSNGEAQLRIVELPFDEEGWPVPGGP